MSADPTNAERKRRMRQKRANEGLTEVRVWLTKTEVVWLDDLKNQEGIDLPSRQSVLREALYRLRFGNL